MTTFDAILWLTWLRPQALCWGGGRGARDRKWRRHIRAYIKHITERFKSFICFQVLFKSGANPMKLLRDRIRSESLVSSRFEPRPPVWQACALSIYPHPTGKTSKDTKRCLPVFGVVCEFQSGRRTSLRWSWSCRWPPARPSISRTFGVRPGLRIDPEVRKNTKLWQKKITCH